MTVEIAMIVGSCIGAVTVIVTQEIHAWIKWWNERDRDEM